MECWGMVRVEGILKNWPASKPLERMVGAEPDQHGEVGSEARGKRVMGWAEGRYGAYAR